MAKKISDRIGQSPSEEIAIPTGDEWIPVAEPQGTSPETYLPKIIQISSLPSGSTADFRTITADATLAISDAGGVVYCNIAGSPPASVVLTVPTNASVPFDVNTLLNAALLENAGSAISPATTLTIQGATGVTINGVSAGLVVLTTPYSAVALHKIGTDEWTVL